METKHLIALPLLAIALIVGVSGSLMSRRFRDGIFVLLAAAAVFGELMDVNFFTHYWYRGTTRGLEFSILDVLAISLLIGAVHGRGNEDRRRFWPVGLGCLLAYFAYAAFSVFISTPYAFGIFELSKIARGILVFVAAALFVRGPRELKLLVLGLGGAVCLQAVAAVMQRYLDGVYRATGTLDHANSLSMFLCLAGPVFVAVAASNLPRWLRAFGWVCIGASCVTILLTVSRAGIPAFGLVMVGAALFCASLRPTIGKIAVATAIVFVGAFLLRSSWDTLKARYAEATLATEYLDPNTEGRGYYLRAASAILSDRAMGVGLNNWSYAVSKTYGSRIGFPYEDYDNLVSAPSQEVLPTIRFAAPAHSLAALTAGELGWFGLLLFVVLWLRWLQAGAAFLPHRSDDAMRQLAVGCVFGVCGLLLQSITEWTYRQTPIFFTCHILLGTLAALYHVHRQARVRAPVRMHYSAEVLRPLPA